MNEIISNICKKLDNDLKQIDSENPEILKKSEQSIFCIRTSLKQLKECICNKKFSTQEDEIFFFKVIKPSVYSKLIYFVKIFNIESKRPTGSDKSQKKYLLNELKKLEVFFFENLEFYQYIRNNMTHLDDKYFVRGILDIHLYVSTFYYDADPGFSTSHDYKVARIMANDLLCVYLNTELAVIDQKECFSGRHSQFAKGKYTWTESKIALVELIYALQVSGCVNSGKADIKEIAMFFESIFCIDLGDYYRTYLEIKNRQNPSKFLNFLRDCLIKKIEQQDY